MLTSFMKNTSKVEGYLHLASFPFVPLIVFLVLFMVHYLWIPSYDWNVFHGAINSMLAGNNPYDYKTDMENRVHNPPWALVALIPVALLPERVGSAFVSSISFMALWYIVKRMGGGKLTQFAYLTAVPVFQEMRAGNVDWLAALGVIMPPQIGLFFILIKPQIGWPLALFWMIETWRNGGFWGVVRVFAPVTIAYLLSFLVFGLYPLHYGRLVDFSCNFSLWPASIPIGLVLLWNGIKNRNASYALLSSGFLSPYLIFQSYLFPLLGFVGSLQNLTIANIGMWVFLIVNGGWSTRRF